MVFKFRVKVSMYCQIPVPAGGYEMTQAELTRKDEFYSIYWKEYNAVKNGMNSELKELPDYLEKRSVFEAKA